jgi:hypothetical protein
MKITITDLRRKANFKQLVRWLAEHKHIEVTHDGDAAVEIHPPGTGNDLEELTHENFELLMDLAAENDPG